MKTPSRRALVSSGALLTGAGLIGAVRFGRWASGDGPGARSFTAGSVPAGIDQLAHARVPELDDAARTATVTLLRSPMFEDVPETIASLVAGETASEIDPAGLKKLVLCGDEDGAAAILWVTWSEAELVGELEVAGTASAENRTRRDRTARRFAESTLVSLTDDAFAIGARAATDAIEDVWNGDGEPLTGELLRTFEGARSDAPLRFAFAERGGQCDEGIAATDGTRIFGSVRTTDGDWVIDAGLWAESLDGATAIKDEVVADLGLSKRTDGPEPVVTDEVRRYLSVDREGSVVELRYRSPATESPVLIASVIEVLHCSLQA